MTIINLRASIWLGICSLCLATSTQGEQLPHAAPQKRQQLTPTNKSATASAIAGEYGLASSSTSPTGAWLFSKGRLSVKWIDDHHILILFACEWKNEAKAGCGEWWVAQLREGNLYLQDMNTFNINMYFEPATRIFTITTRGADSQSTLRTDVFQVNDTALTDRALIRRMKNASSSFHSPEGIRVFGHHSKWKYSHARIQIPE